MTSAATVPERLTFSKHEGAGNDFLVLVDPDDRVRLTAEQVRVLCDRHFGVGADGVIRVGRGRRPAGPAAGNSPAAGAAPATDLWMELRNADGGEAEMSGNGIRCLAQAAVDAGLVAPPRFTVDTLAGIRTVEYQPGDTPGTAWAGVDMGAVRLGPEEPGLQGWAGPPGHRARRVDVGNPHLVLLGPDDPDTVDVADVGPSLQGTTPGGVNVELVAVGPGPGELTLRVWERGVGETLACGTGSCAAAAAARAWGVVGDVVLVHNPGGALEVRLGPSDDDPVVLSGPTRRVAAVDVDPAALTALAAGPASAPVPA
ncbi:MAG TPA: diaminopimelate epimerase [Acidimicrobiales bacterium]|nr:diaminopimelate epimerase [Acidimicrobiales bacterium]